MEYETLTGAEINEVIAGKPPSRTQKDEGASVRTSSVPKTGTIKAESRIPTVEKQILMRRTSIKRRLIKLLPIKQKLKLERKRHLVVMHLMIWRKIREAQKILLKQ